MIWLYGARRPTNKKKKRKSDEFENAFHCIRNISRHEKLLFFGFRLHDWDWLQASGQIKMFHFDCSLVNAYCQLEKKNNARNFTFFFTLFLFSSLARDAAAIMKFNCFSSIILWFVFFLEFNKWMGELNASSNKSKTIEKDDYDRIGEGDRETQREVKKAMLFERMRSD